MKRLLGHSVIAAGCALTGGAAQADDAQLARLAGLAGCWMLEGAEAGSGEQWMPLAGGTLLGMSRTVRRGRTTGFEFMQIRHDDQGRLAFFAQPSGRPATVFPLLRQEGDEVVFEQPAHDFPQRVVYRFDGPSRLDARIEGRIDGTPRTIDFPMRRVPCEATPVTGTR